ncbi:RluA family pseudouridine synthase [Pseudalkalibacillus sp. Hm43]|uniref:RluA family pseudouridine synthase n=1 Tax=Pseudalkalibacillus sp. Hm43 TaxID=3450742 RepID=UPI003F436086
MKPLEFTWTIHKRSEGKTLRDYLLKDQLISRQALTDIKFKGGDLKVNDEQVTVRYILKAGDIVTVIFPVEEISEYMEPIELPLSVLYEDDHFLVVDKPAGLPTIPSRFRSKESLAQGILHYYEENQIASTIHAVNRLDRNTSGIVLFAKHRYGHSLLSRQQKEGKLKRTYVALCHGIPDPRSGTIDAPIGRKEGSIIERCIRPDGQQAKTHYKVLASYKEYAFLKLRLETGRTHQIRVHMAHIGHPLLGDDLYGGTLQFIERQALHSQTLAFYHPFNEKRIEIQAPLPEDMEVWIDR